MASQWKITAIGFEVVVLVTGGVFYDLQLLAFVGIFFQQPSEL